MDFWSSLCPNVSTNHQRNLKQLSRRRRTDSPLLNHPRRRSSSATSKRLSYSISGKLARSFPSTVEAASTTDLFRQYSIEDFAMQNNYTVIGNKVGPVIIKNCSEEYQMVNTKRNVTGQLHKQSTEHELLLDKYFLLKDNFVGVDRHETTGENGVPNMHVVGEKPTIYAVGQPTMNGLRKFTDALMTKHTFIYYINVRALPTLFLRRSGDFVPYSAYTPKRSDESTVFRKERDILDAEREMQLQALKIAAANSGLFYYYNVLDSSPDEPHMYQTTAIEDLITSRQLFSKVQSENPNFKYRRIVLPHCEDPSAEWIESLVDVMKEIMANKNHDNVALVFQCLTGEGAARLAAMVALLSLENPFLSITPDEEKMLDRIRSIQSELKWRTYMTKNVTTDVISDRTQHEIDCAIARFSTVDGIYSITSRLPSMDGYISMLGDEELIAKKSITSKLQGRNQFFRTESLANITLREVSELSISSIGSDNDLSRLTMRIRLEFVDEEKLMKSLLFNMDIYYLLLVFRTYVIAQRPYFLRVSFTQWLAYNPKYLFDISQVSSASHDMPEINNTQHPFRELRMYEGQSCDIAMDPTFHRVAGCPLFGIAQTTKERFTRIVKRLCGVHSRKKYRRLEFINVRDDSIFYHYSSTSKRQKEEKITEGDGTEGLYEDKETLWEFPLTRALPCMFGAKADIVDAVEDRLSMIFSNYPDSTSFAECDYGRNVTDGEWKSTKQMMFDIKADDEVKELCDDINYKRIPLPKYRIPRFECFDELITTLRDAIDVCEDTAFIFFCHNGKKRTTNMMVAASLVLLHLEKFDLGDAPVNSNYVDFCAHELTKGEYKVILELMQILPDCHHRKKEVDAALDICHENMSTMHYHLREHLNPCFEKAMKAKTFEKYLILKHRAYLGLELYAFLIIFNCYLHQEKQNMWRRISFADWMSQYACRLGVLDVLDNFGTTDLGQDYPMNCMKMRWMDNETLAQKVNRDSPLAGECEKGSEDHESFGNSDSASNLDVISEYGY